MRFIPIDKKKKAETLAFLAKLERSCVSLVEHIRRGRDDGFIVENDAHEKLGVISVKSRMLVCIPNARFLQNDKTVCSSFKAFLSDKKISCVNGEAEASHFIMKVLAEDGRPPLHINEYTLMTLSESALQLLRTKSERHGSIPEEKQMRSDRQMHVFENMQTCAPHTESARRQSEYAAVHPVSKNAATDRGGRAGFEKCKIVRCGIEDADALMPLQLAYEAEEVIPPCRMRNSAVTRKNLERILKTECARYPLGADRRGVHRSRFQKKRIRNAPRRSACRKNRRFEAISRTLRKGRQRRRTKSIRRARLYENGRIYDCVLLGECRLSKMC